MYEQSYWDMLISALLSTFHENTESGRRNHIQSEERVQFKNHPIFDPDKITLLIVHFINENGATSGDEIDHYLSNLGEKNPQKNLHVRINLARAGILMRNRNYCWELTEKGKTTIFSQP